ncbi:hypothetical protein QOT17_005954 [Balamuthia mandrillaris]
MFHRRKMMEQNRRRSMPMKQALGEALAQGPSVGSPKVAAGPIAPLLDAKASFASLGNDLDDKENQNRDSNIMISVNATPVKRNTRRRESIMRTKQPGNRKSLNRRVSFSSTVNVLLFEKQQNKEEEDGGAAEKVAWEENNNGASTHHGGSSFRNRRTSEAMELTMPLGGVQVEDLDAAARLIVEELTAAEEDGFASPGRPSLALSKLDKTRRLSEAMDLTIPLGSFQQDMIDKDDLSDHFDHLNDTNHNNKTRRLSENMELTLPIGSWREDLKGALGGEEEFNLDLDLSVLEEDDEERGTSRANRTRRFSEAMDMTTPLGDWRDVLEDGGPAEDVSHNLALDLNDEGPIEGQNDAAEEEDTFDLGGIDKTRRMSVGMDLTVPLGDLSSSTHAIQEAHESVLESGVVIQERIEDLQRNEEVAEEDEIEKENANNKTKRLSVDMEFTALVESLGGEEDPLLSTEKEDEGEEANMLQSDRTRRISGDMDLTLVPRRENVNEANEGTKDETEDMGMMTRRLSGAMEFTAVVGGFSSTKEDETTNDIFAEEKKAKDNVREDEEDEDNETLTTEQLDRAGQVTKRLSIGMDFTEVVGGLAATKQEDAQVSSSLKEGAEEKRSKKETEEHEPTALSNGYHATEPSTPSSVGMKRKTPSSPFPSFQKDSLERRLRAALLLRPELEQKEWGCENLTQAAKHLAEESKALSAELGNLSAARAVLSPNLSILIKQKSAVEAQKQCAEWCLKLEQSVYSRLEDNMESLKQDLERVKARLAALRQSRAQRIANKEEEVAENQDMHDILTGLQLWHPRVLKNQKLVFLFHAKPPLKPYELTITIGKAQTRHRPILNANFAPVKDLYASSSSASSSSSSTAKKINDPFAVGLLKSTNIQTIIQSLSSTKQLNYSLEEISFRLNRVQHCLSEVSKLSRNPQWKVLQTGMDQAVNSNGQTIPGNTSFVEIMFSNLKRHSKFVVRFHGLGFGYCFGDLQFSFRKIFGTGVDEAVVRERIEACPKGLGRLAAVCDALCSL